MIEILQLDKKHAADEATLRAAVAQERPDSLIEGVVLDGDNWLVRVKTAEGDLPPFMKKKEDPAAGGDEAADDAEDALDGGDDEAAEGEGDEKKPGDEKGKGKGDPLAELKTIIEQAQKVFEELGGKAEEVAADAEEKGNKIDEINDSIQEHVKGPGAEDAPLPGDIGPTPGAGPVPPGAGGPPKRPGVPSGKPPVRPGMNPGGGIPAFTNRQTEIVRHPGVDENGEWMSIVAAAAKLEEEEAFANYYVDGMTTNSDGTYSAKLKLRN